jgi:hypothetical protein
LAQARRPGFSGDPGERQPPDDSQHSTIDAAVVFLREALASGPRPAADVLVAAATRGFSERTIERAKAKAGVKSMKQGMGDGWAWELPASLARADTLGHLAPFGATH